MELRFLALSVAGALFLLSLLSFNAFLYPLASYTGLVDLTTLNHNVYLYYTSTTPLYHNYVLGFTIFSAMACLYTIFLPSRYDPFAYIGKKLNWEGE